MQTMVPLYGFGGVPYSAVRKAAPRNLLDNSDFRNPVNQRGQASYTGEYGIDRWRVWNSDTLTVNSGYITGNGSVFQYLLPSVVQNSVHTLAAKKTDGSILLYTKNPSEAYSTADNGLGLGLDNNVVIHLPTGSYLWAALYEGSYTAETLPEYQPKGYGAELAECQRYCLVIDYEANNFFAGYMVATTTTMAGAFFPLPVPMRTTPSLSSTDGSTWLVTIDGAILFPTDASIWFMSANAILGMRFNFPSELGLNKTGVVNYNSSTKLILSADL